MKTNILPIAIAVIGTICWISCQSKPASTAKPAPAAPSATEASSSASETKAQPAPEAFVVLAEGSQSSVQEHAIEIVRDTTGLATLWTKFSKAPAPYFDFSSQVVVAVFMGMRNSGGYHYELGNKELKDGVWNIKVIESRPGLKEMVTMALTNPYIVFTVPKTSKDPLISIEQVQRK